MGIFASKNFNPDRDIPDLTGKVILVTGGKCVARQFHRVPVIDLNTRGLQ